MSRAEAWRLKIGLLYGCGLRISECLNIRIKDVDLCGKTLTAYGKGGKSRALGLPERLLPALEREIAVAKQLYEADRAAGNPGVSLPDAFAVKTTEKYVRLARAMRGDVRSPLDKLWD